MRLQSPFRSNGSSAGVDNDFTAARLRWLIDMRWVAMAGIFAGAALTKAGFFPGASWQVLVGSGVFGVLFNAHLLRSHATAQCWTGRRAALLQAAIDVVLLTIVLWAVGGMRSPFVALYVFHVVIVGVLGGARATFQAAAVVLVCAGFLGLTEFVPELRIGEWSPVPPWDFIAQVFALVSIVAGISYQVTNTVQELRDRERALELARDQAALEFEVLSRTLNELEAGLEVIDVSGEVLWRNKRAEALAPTNANAARKRTYCPGFERNCERDTHGDCPIEHALETSSPGRCRFAADVDGGERVYEMLTFPLATAGEEHRRVMNLYVDRTQTTVAERTLVLAERLASLGRIAQGVAHELNTPLATIRTLAADMHAALGTVAAAPNAGERQRAVDDMRESAALIQDETRRLGRITHALLAGGDLVRAKVEGAVPLLAVVERARALVFAGVRTGPSVQIDSSLDTLTLAVDADRLVQILVNLLSNSHDALREQADGHVWIHARIFAREVELVVDDDGPGIDAQISSRLFEPFATTKPLGQGTGLGLYTSYMLAQALGGSLSIGKREERGTRAVIRLPLRSTKAAHHLDVLPGAAE